MKILILGAGAVGGYFGARLIESGADVTFLVRKKRSQLLKKQGLKIISPCGDINLKVKTITNDEISPVYDVILLTNKSYDMDEILETNFPIKNSSVIIPLLNGFTHIRKLEKKFIHVGRFDEGTSYQNKTIYDAEYKDITPNDGSPWKKNTNPKD